MNPKNLEALLESLATLTDDDSANWLERAAALKAKASEMGERYSGALEEFLAWFEAVEE